MEIILWMITGISIGAALFFFIRWYRLRKALKYTDRELTEITADMDANRLLKQEEPDRELGKLLITINGLLKEIREERNSFEKRERDFQRQIESISHDLRTPLTSMSGYLKIIGRDRLTAEDEENLDTAIRKTELLKRLIAQFYDYSRLTAQDLVLKKEEVDVTRLLRETLANDYQMLTKKNLNVLADIPETPIFATANEEGLERIFMNLVQNAVRYAASALEIRLTREKEGICVRFANDTRDLTQEEADQIFQRFYTGEQSRTRGSTGLGLTVSKSLAERMGGTLTAHLGEDGWLRLELKI